MRRRLLNLLTVLSLLLCMATVALWVRSYYVDERVTYLSRPLAPTSRAISVVMHTRGGHVIVVWSSTDYSAMSTGEYLVFSSRLRKVTGPDGWRYKRSRWDSLHTLVEAVTSSDNGITLDPVFQKPLINHATSVSVPHWLQLIPLLLLPGRWAVTRCQRPRGALCPACGYDLRATPERCPECGRDAAGVA